MSPNHFSAIRRKLLRWYDKHHRDLPWRRTTDPYAIWISETMLQQTQITTVVPYYERFLKRFPTVAALAQAPLPRVLTLWSGLGYYRRAENLKKCAQQLVLSHGGRIPADYGKLVSLPGIGQYTAGALMSIAFGRRYTALDGNARRVFRRIFNSPQQTELDAIAERLVSKSRPGDFNQAVMELGATVCIPKSPRCAECPLAVNCWTKHHRAPDRPAAQESRTLKNVTWPLTIVRKRGRLLLHRRDSAGMLAGLWEFPGGVIDIKRCREKRCREGLRRRVDKTIGETLKLHLRELYGTLQANPPIGELRHTITDKRIRAPVFLIDLSPGVELNLAPTIWRWVAPSSLHRYPVSAMTLKAASLLASHEKGLA